MSTLKIASWNVNSLRVRLPHVLQLIASHQPDVIALQETKVIDADFPIEAIKDQGYVAVYAGQPAYNGVAFLSKEPLTEVLTSLPDTEDQQKRFLAATIGDTRVINLYVPNGDNVNSEKFTYKLNWLNNLANYLEAELKKYPKVVMMGDFNIAPETVDVHAPEQWEGKVLFSAAERSAFKRILDLGFKDCFRHTNPTTQQFSWWDYRLNAYKRNLGLRIDHIISSETFLNNCQACVIDETPRSWERPSDHAPVIAVFNK